MKHHLFALRDRSEIQFNMTAMIDVVLLLIIFFMLVCQFIGQENYRLFIPDECANAVVEEHLDPEAVTVSVFTKPDTDQLIYAVRANQLGADSGRYTQRPDLLVAELTDEIRRELRNGGDGVVHLRADKRLAYGQVQEALRAVAMAGVSRVQLAAFQSEQARPAESNDMD